MGAQWKAKGKAQAADARGKLLGRVTVPGCEPLDAWKPPRKVVGILETLHQESRL